MVLKKLIVRSIVSGLVICSAACLSLVLAQDRAMLLEESWDQQQPYNAQASDTLGQSVYIGCTGTALAQVIHYWGRKTGVPEQVFTQRPGDGPQSQYRSYRAEQLDRRIDPHIAALSSIDYATQDSQGSIAFAAAVSIHTDFGELDDRIGSSAYLDDVAAALTGPLPWPTDSTPGAWDFASAAFRSLRQDTDSYPAEYIITLDEALEEIREDIEVGRPVIIGLEADSEQGGHTVVVDGYRVIAGRREIHIRFGWGGDGDGWYVPERWSSSNPETIYDASGSVMDYHPTGISGIVYGIHPTESSEAPVVSFRIGQAGKTLIIDPYWHWYGDRNPDFTYDPDGSIDCVQVRFGDGPWSAPYPTMDIQHSFYEAVESTISHSLSSFQELEVHVRAIDNTGNMTMQTEHVALEPGETGAILWQRMIGPGSQGWMPWQPAIASDGTIYIIGDSGASLYSLSPDGYVKSHFQSRNVQFAGTPAISADGSLYVNYANDLQRISSGGEFTWSHRNELCGMPFESVAVCSEDRLVALFNPAIKYGPTDCQNQLNLLDAGVGARLVSRGVTGLLFERDSSNLPVVGGDCVYLILDGALHAWSASDLREEWVYEPAEYFDYASLPAIGADGYLYFWTDAGYLYAVGPTGRLRGQRRAEYLADGFLRPPTRFSPVIGHDGTVYVAACSELHAYAPDLRAEKWATATGQALTMPAVGADGTVYAGSLTGHLYFIDPAEGDVTRQLRFPGEVSFPTPTPGGDLLVVVDTGWRTIYSVFAGDVGDLKALWPTWQHDVQRTGRAQLGEDHGG